MRQRKPVVLISGCSSGIGLALTREFAKTGHYVFATALELSAIEHLRNENTEILALDVTNASSIADCVRKVIDKAGQIDILVNNAGYGLFGPVAELTMEEIKAQFETNFFGVIALSQAVIPYMIEKGSGKIVNISSVSGIVSTAFGGGYCSSKAALNSISDVLRVELAPFGIKVTTIQPSSVKTNFAATATKGLEKYYNGQSKYVNIADYIYYRATLCQENSIRAEDFAKIAVQKISLSNPPPIIRIGKESNKLPLLKLLLPPVVVDKIITKKFGLHKLYKNTAVSS